MAYYKGITKEGKDGKRNGNNTSEKCQEGRRTYYINVLFEFECLNSFVSHLPPIVKS